MQCPKLFIFCECDGFKVNNLTDPNSSQCNQYDDAFYWKLYTQKQKHAIYTSSIHMRKKKILIEFNDVWACICSVHYWRLFISTLNISMYRIMFSSVLFCYCWAVHCYDWENMRIAQTDHRPVQMICTIFFCTDRVNSVN